MLAAAFILGLFGSLHCVGMCGPIALSLPFGGQNPLGIQGRLMLYHMGRLMTYGLLGLLLGVLGQGLAIMGILQYFSIAAGILLILMVVVPRWAPYLTRFNAVLSPAWRSLRPFFQDLFSRKSWDAYFGIGVLNGLLPCGLVYMGLLGSLVQKSLIDAVGFMLFFGLGTIPLLSFTVYAAHWVPRKTIQKLYSYLPVMIFFLGVLLVVRGLGLNIPYLSPEFSPQTVQSMQQCAPSLLE